MAFDIVKNDSRLEKGIFKPFRARYIPKELLNKFSRSKDPSSFGESESDFLEASIYDQDRLLLSNKRYKSFDPISDREIAFDIGTHVVDANLPEGSKYIIQYSFFRTVLGELGDEVTLFVEEISEDRTEVRVFPVLVGDEDIDLETTERFASFFNEPFDSYTDEGQSSAFKFVMNFGNNIYYHIVNWSVVRNDEGGISSVLFKLFDPLREQITVGDEFNIHEEPVDPYFDRFNYKTFPEEPTGNVLASPNFNVDTDISSGEGNTGFQTWDTLLETENEKVSTQKLLDRFINKDEEKVDLNIDFNDFENFVHFSSAEERLKNFRYKLSLIERYQSEIEEQQKNAPSKSIGQDNYSKQVIEENKEKISEVKNSFDDYEQWLFEADYEENENTYPKKTGKLYPGYKEMEKESSGLSDEEFWYGDKLVDLDSQESKDWFDRMLERAKEYDSKNNDRLVNNIPVYIKEDPENESFVLFMEMIGHFFDLMWVYIKHMKYLTDRSEDINELESLSKDLSQYVAKSFGQELYNGFDNQKLLDYGFDVSEQEESVEYVFSPLNDSPENKNSDEKELYGNDVIFDTTDDDKPEGLERFIESGEDVQKHFWRRFLNSIPYLTKSKGTKRSVSALLSTYGVPRSALTIKEYGGTKLNHEKTLYEFNDDTYCLSMVGSGSGMQTTISSVPSGTEHIKVPWGETGSVTVSNESWSNYMMVHNDKANSLELRFKTEYLPDDDLVLFEIEDTILVTLEPHPSFTDPSTGEKLELEKPYGVVKVYLKEKTEPSAQDTLELGMVDGNGLPSGVDKEDVYRNPENYLDEDGGPLPVFEDEWYNFKLSIDPEIFGITASIQRSSRFGNIMFEREDSVGSGANGGDGSGPSKADFPTFLSSEELTLAESIVTANYLYLGGNPGGSFSSRKGFAGDIDNLRYWKEPIPKKKYDQHTKGPVKYDWDNEDLILEENRQDLFDPNVTVNRNLLLNLDFTNVEEEDYIGDLGNPNDVGDPNKTNLKNESPNKSFIGKYEVEAVNFDSEDDYPYQFDRYTRKNFIFSTQVGSNSITNDKIRLRDTNLIGQSLSSERRNEVGDLDNIVDDSERLGVFFSPQSQVDRDIILSVGVNNINDLLGDPRDNDRKRYKGLEGFNRKYWLKYDRPYNLNEYFRYVKQFNKAFFKRLRNLVPARSDLRDGLLVKSHLLERSKTEGIQTSKNEEDKRDELDLDVTNLTENSTIEDEKRDEIGPLDELGVESDERTFLTKRSFKLNVDKRYAGNLDPSTNFQTKSSYRLEELYKDFDRQTFESFTTEQQKENYLDGLDFNCELKTFYRRIPFSNLDTAFIGPLNDPQDYFQNNYIFFSGDTFVYGDPDSGPNNQPEFTGVYGTCTFYSGGNTEISNEKFIVDNLGETIRKPQYPYQRDRHYIYNREFYTAAKRMKHEGVVCNEETTIIENGPVNITFTAPERIIASPTGRDKSGPVLEIE